MRIGILEHEPDAPAGYFEQWALARGHACSVLPVPTLGSWPTPTAHDLIVSLGSERSVHASPERWIPQEIEFVRDAQRQVVPVLGICFGSQLLAAALGARVKRAAKPYAEWRAIDTEDAELISTGPWLRWHEDVFELPTGAELLAGKRSEPLAFAAGRDVGLQFHPEATREIAEGWLRSGRERLAEQQIDARRLQDEIRAGSDGARERAFVLFDAIAARWWS